MTHYVGRARLTVTPVDAKANTLVFHQDTLRGASRVSYWWFLFVGPFESGTLPQAPKRHKPRT
jgi:hypothetical protein